MADKNKAESQRVARAAEILDEDLKNWHEIKADYRIEKLVQQHCETWAVVDRLSDAEVSGLYSHALALFRVFEHNHNGKSRAIQKQFFMDDNGILCAFMWHDQRNCVMLASWNDKLSFWIMQ
jgi:3-methyladenine DNA glycosylase AlkD